MDKEAIKDELIKECELLISSAKNNKHNAGVTKLEALANHIGTVGDFTKTINVVLNEILKQQNVTKFKNEEEKSELLVFLKPTIAELMRKYIKV